MIDMFGTGFEKLAATLVAREKMQSTITSNIANADTPNYRADQRTFASFLDAQQSGLHAPAATTNKMHFSDFDRSRSDSIFSDSIFKQHNSRRMDGNNVDLEQEMARLSENQLMHELSMRLIKGRLSGLKNAIREGK